MKHYKVALTAAVMAMAWSACDNDIDVIGEWKEIPVVYGILKPQDTAQYIVIQKAYLPPNTSAYEVAQNPDSLYFPADELSVKLYQNGIFFDSLRRVDAALDGYPRDSGIFVSTPNYAYKTTRRLALGMKYKLEIKSHRTGSTYTSEATTLDSFIITSPSTTRPIKWSQYVGANVTMNDVRFGWQDVDNSNIYDMDITFRYDEYQVDNSNVEIPSTRQTKTIVWHAIRSYMPEATIDKQINGVLFYQFLANNLSDVTDTNIRRCARNIDVQVFAGGVALGEYIKSRSANDNLIGGLFPADPYTNISNGLGVFSVLQRSSPRTNLPLDTDVHTYLNGGDITRTLGFGETACP